MTINNTKIKYLSVIDKIYDVNNIDFWDLAIEARETDLKVGDVQDDEVFDIEGFRDFKIKLMNRGEAGKVIDFVEWKRRHQNAADS